MAAPLPARRRPRRGAPEDTRNRLIEAARRVFNDVGYHGTDSNRLAQAAGYAPGTFYRHFPDKKAIFLAAYGAHAEKAWADIGEELARARSTRELARTLVARIVAQHREWRGLHSSLRSLAAVDPDAHAFQLDQRRGHLARIDAVRRDRGLPPLPREQGVIVLFALERMADAIADGDVRELGLSEKAVVRALESFVEGQLT